MNEGQDAKVAHEAVQAWIHARSKRIDTVRRRERRRAFRDLFAFGGDVSQSRQGEYAEFMDREPLSTQILSSGDQHPGARTV